MIQIEVIIDRLVWESRDNDFKIYGAVPANSEDIAEHDLKFNGYNNLTLNGILPKLEIGTTYKATLKEKAHPKHGVGYEVLNIFQELPRSIDEQRAYLSTLLTELQVKNIYNVYEGKDVIQLMKDNEFDYNLVSGLGEHTYNIIRTKVLSNLELQEALVALTKYGLTYSIVSKLVKKYGSASLVVQRIEDNPYVLTEVDGIGFLKCDDYALSMGMEKDSPKRITACINYVLSEESDKNGHSWVSRESLLKKSTELLGIDLSYVESLLNSYNGKLLYIKDDKVARMNLYNYEKWIHEAVKKLLSSKPEPIDNLNERIEFAEKKQGFKFTDEQRDAIVKSVENNIIVITGKAGTGKTTILKGVVEVLKGSGKFKNYFACALSGKASQRIAESTGLNASTIHRLLGSKEEGQGFFYDYENSLPHGVVILDEASMANSYIFHSLNSAIDEGSKFVILGDVEQLEPIGAGNVLKDLIDSGAIPVAFLTQVHRQAQKSGILSIANQVREGIQFADSNDYEDKVLGELKDLHFKPYRRAESVKKAILKACRQYLKAPDFDLMNFQVIVPMKNRGEIATKKLNVELQKIFNPEIKPVLSRNGFDFKQGDKVIQNGNNYDVNVFNGTLGIVENVDTIKKEITINFVGTGNVTYSQEDMNQIDLAYALTVHKVQGSQFDNVVIGIDYSSYMLLGRQLIYTALTRASKLCILAVELEALTHAIRTNKSSKRNTFLKDLLVG
jgi:exodeoxyribonuclease V alpha subunit